MPAILPEDISRFVRAVGPDPDEVLLDMDDRARRAAFPTVGPAVGGYLAVLARSVGVTRAFEFGSGFGYSAYWIARVLPEDGEVILTERDTAELDQARDYFARGGLEDRATFEAGDALDTVSEYDGPFEYVLIDNEKDRYVEAFEAVRSKVPAGGVVVADNAMTAGSVDFETVLAILEGEDPVDVTAGTRGIADYLQRVREDEAFETVALPLGEGIAVSHRMA